MGWQVGGWVGVWVVGHRNASEPPAPECAIEDPTHAGAERPELRIRSIQVSSNCVEFLKGEKDVVEWVIFHEATKLGW